MRNKTGPPAEIDALYAEGSEAAGEAEPFVFDQRVVRVFPDMIRRSVPGYGLVVANSALLAREHVRDDSHVYDLGCSLGAVALAMAQSIDATGVRIIAVDSSPDMIARLERRLAANPPRIPIEPCVADIRSFPISEAAVVVMNYTLQFIAPEARDALVERVAQGMLPGGVLILTEKLCFDDQREQARQTRWHHQFKRAQGYSELEIAGKRDALEGVLVPEPERAHLRRLEKGGFSAAYRWFQCYSFASYIAFR